jgi:hypothetical protein
VSILSTTIGVLAIVAFVGVWAAIVIHRGRQFAALAERGVPATATVSRRFTTGRRQRGKRIGFTYAGPDGREYERFATIGTERYEALAVGDALPIVLLPDAPGTSAPGWLVQSAREALAKRKT